MQERTCGSCGQARLVELEMRAKGGQLLTMLSCTRCESRVWLADGQPVVMSEVLKLTAGDPEFAVQPSASSSRRSARR
jgi:hypothetical protein